MEIRDVKNKLSYPATVAIITIIGALIVGLVIIKPLWSKNVSLTKERNAKQAELATMKNRLEVLNDLKDEEASLKKDSETISSALPTQEEIGRLFIQLDSIAKTSGGNLRSVSQINSTDMGSAGIKETQYSIPLDMPSYFALKQFITNSESALNLLSISNIKIDSTETGALTVNITAKSYSRSK